ncbi:EGF-like domain-containing protein [Aphelenchoides fujianensis]|nr:EGF-like domain-containing protein [Aphelenchoides fujianensis]
MFARKPLLLVGLVGLLVASISAARTPAPKCEYSCGDAQCVSGMSRCDNIKDCENGADEKNCDYLHNCSPGLFMCKSGECLEAETKCNGTAECADESDERGCRAVAMPIHLPTAADFEHDMKHTSLPPARRAPQQTPKAKKVQCAERNASLYFSNDATMVYRVSLSGAKSKASELFLTSKGGMIQSLAVDFARKELLYVADRLSSQVHAVDQTDASDRVLLEEKYRRFSCVAKDWVTGNVYFAEDGVGIGVCMEEPRYLWDDTAVQCKLVIESAPTDQHKYRDLIVDPTRGMMMWIQDEPEGKLMIAGMDGTKIRSLSAFGHVNAIAFDYEQERLYVAENDELDVMNIRTLERTSMKPIKPSTMAVYNCELFFIERTWRTGPHQIIMMLSGPRFSMALVGENSTIGNQQNPCESLECPEFCVLSEGVLEPAALCQCSDCREAAPQEEGNVLGLLFGILAFLAVLAILTVIAVVYFRLCPVLCEHFDRLLNKNEGSPNDSQISIGYQNPTFNTNTA